MANSSLQQGYIGFSDDQRATSETHIKGSKTPLILSIFQTDMIFIPLLLSCRQKRALMDPDLTLAVLEELMEDIKRESHTNSISA